MPYKDPVFSNITWALGKANHVDELGREWLQSCDQRCQEIGGTCEEIDINSDSYPWRKKYLLDIYEGLLNDHDEIYHATGEDDWSGSAGAYCCSPPPPPPAPGSPGRPRVVGWYDMSEQYMSGFPIEDIDFSVRAPHATKLPLACV